MVSFNNKNNFDLYLKRLFFLGMGSARYMLSW